MKKNIKSTVIFMMFLFIGSYGFAQAYTIAGSQTKGTAVGNNAQLSCQAVVITKTVKVYEVSGDNAGFWINKNGTVIQKYWETNDKRAVGLVLTPGTYYVYPNLKKGQTTAKVVLKLN